MPIRTLSPPLHTAAACPKSSVRIEDQTSWTERSTSSPICTCHHSTPRTAIRCARCHSRGLIPQGLDGDFPTRSAIAAY